MAEPRERTAHPRGPLLALAGLEIRRAAPPVLRGLVALVVVLPVLLLAGVTRKDILAAVPAVLGMSFVLAVAMNGVRDRIDGGLEFIQSLPVEPGVAAGARMVACAATCAVAAPLVTGALAVVLPDLLGRPPTLSWVLGTALAFWAAFLVVSSLAAGALLRFRQEQLQRLPLVFLLVLLAASAGLSRILPDPGRFVSAAAAAPWFPVAAPVAAWTVGLLGAWAAHRLLTAAIRDFSPVRDRIDW